VSISPESEAGGVANRGGDRWPGERKYDKAIDIFVILPEFQQFWHLTKKTLAHFGT
jgi:hypothetical protein